MSEELRRRKLPDDVEELVRRLTETSPPEEACRLLANTANRAIAALHKVSRDQASARKGTKTWASWAKLASASRNAVLAASMCREVANDLAAATEQTPSEGNPDDGAGTS